jgi:membrane protease YdiL (CAAX protease family)
MLVPTLARRYDGRIAMVVSATLYAIVFGTPVAVLLVFGLILADLTRRHKNGIEPLLAQLTLHIGLVVAVAVSPFVRSLFF